MTNLLQHLKTDFIPNGPFYKILFCDIKNKNISPLNGRPKMVLTDLVNSRLFLPDSVRLNNR